MNLKLSGPIKGAALSAFAIVSLCAGPMAVSAWADFPLQWQTGYGYERTIGGQRLFAVDPDGPGLEEITVATVGPIAHTCNYGMQMWRDGRWQPMGTTSVGLQNSGSAIYPTTFEGQPLVARTSNPTVIRWDGQEWQPMGSLFPESNMRWVDYDGVLHAISGSYVYRWNGTLFEVVSQTTSGMRAARAFQGRLIVGGSILQLNGVTMNNVMAWDGVAWSPLGDGVPIAPVVDFAERDGLLLALTRGPTCGTCNRVMAWDGTTWTEFGPALEMAPTRMQVIGDQLYIGGDTASSALGHSLVRWDGAGWERFAAATPGLWTVAAMTEANGNLIISGKDFPFGQVPFVAKWDGERMSFLGGHGFGSSGFAGDPNGGHIHAFFSTGEELFAAGSFVTTGDGPANRVAEWREGRWSPLGSSLIMAPPHDRIFPFEGGIVATRSNAAPIVWDGMTWTSPHASFILDGFTVFPIGEMNGRLVGKIGGPTSYLIRENGQWQPLAPGQPASIVKEWVFDDCIVAYGSQEQNRLFHWNGEAWRSFENGPTTLPLDVAIHQGKVVAIMNGEVVMFDENGLNYIGDFPAVRLLSLNAELLAVKHNSQVLPYAQVSIWNGTTWQDDELNVLYDDGSTCGQWGNVAVNTVIRHQNSILFGGDFAYIGNPNTQHIDSGNFAVLKTGHPPGDMNADDLVDLADVPAFIAGLLDPSAMSIYATLASDVNADGFNNGSDLHAFVEALLSE